MATELAHSDSNSLAVSAVRAVNVEFLEGKGGMAILQLLRRRAAPQVGRGLRITPSSKRSAARILTILHILASVSK
ncbi:hypothetical protein DL766_001677 [Monosporascus sp. MC13-8B]|uniref:Uncharacterized protein n=1 Tax=Monosporascus cannonballus TaxID=155416 RepID=A0ABY0H963_9PEZI|nr:hypothetical protein DL762_005444 [Monosporascus cannonballus]RYO90191.1 hypothetical protein DL763_005432 [Monosporascus cannonballus]RYP37103.1 hypothetical protein DL766_001677 [Monosporascus sp. MC13-8B]